MKLLFFDISTGLKSISDLKTGARGGMISSLFILTDLLSRMGHVVSVLSDVKVGGRTEAGVYWGSSPEMAEAEDWDVLICNRTTTEDGLAHARVKKRVLWTHDLPHSGFIPHPNIVKAFHRVVFMSRYAERVWRAFYPAISKSVLIPNGVDKALFYPRGKDLDYLIFGSAPNRGLKSLPLIFEALKNRIRDTLHMTAYSNMKVLHPNENARTTRFWEEEMPLDYKDCTEAGIELKDPVPQSQWAEELGRAGLMIIPTNYPEICSNVILQSLASGVPIVTTGPLGSAGEWISSGYNGMLTQFVPNDYMVHTIEIVRGAKRILDNSKLHNKMIKNAVKTKNLLTWEKVAKRWNKMFERL